MSIFVTDRATHLPIRALINCMYAQYLSRSQWYTCCLYMRRKCWLVKSIESAIVKRNSFLLLSASAVSRYSKQLQLRYSILQLPILSTRERCRSNKNMDIERFFLFVSFSIDTFSSLSSDQQGAALSAFLHYTSSSYQHQFKQQKKCSARKERISLFMLSIAYNTHSRYSGICLLGNIVSGKTYRQLNEQASEQKEEERKTKRLLF